MLEVPSTRLPELTIVTPVAALVLVNRTSPPKLLRVSVSAIMLFA